METARGPERIPGGVGPAVGERGGGRRSVKVENPAEGVFCGKTVRDESGGHGSVP